MPQIFPPRQPGLMFNEQPLHPVVYRWLQELSEIVGGNTPITSLIFTNMAANANETGELQRNSTNLSWHDGTAARNLVSDTATQTLTNKTLTTPTIASFVNATHSHQTAAGGGQLDHGLALTGLSDNDHPQYLLVADIDDTPVNGEVAQPISSNWAFDHVAAADPHTGYRLESADHTHQSTGAQAGQLDHGLALTGLSDNDHPQYLLVVDIDDTPVNGETAAPISSNWAFDHVAAADPHTGYRLESANHTHQSSGAEGGTLDHGLALTGLTDDDHTQYALLAGRSGGQTLNGDTASGGNFIINSTSHATKGNVIVQSGMKIGPTAAAATTAVELGDNATGDRHCLIDYHAESTTYTDYAMRTVRFAGANGNCQAVDQRGTGEVLFRTQEAAQMVWATTNTTRWTLSAAGGLFSSNATNGDQGDGTINADRVYDDAVLLTDHVFDLVKTGQPNFQRWDDTVRQKPPVRRHVILGRFKEKIIEVPRPQRLHEAARRFAQNWQTHTDIERFTEYWNTHGHLSTMPGEAEFAQRKFSLGELTTRVWETIECLAIHNEQLLRRIEALEGA